MEGTGLHKPGKKAGHPHHPHHVVPKHESGYTDEAAEECHDLIDKAEEDAHLHDPNSMYSTTNKPESVHYAKGGLEGSSTSGKGAASSATEKLQQAGKNISSTMGETMEQAKEKMGMRK